MVIRIFKQQIDKINTLMKERKQGKGKVMVTWTMGLTFKNTAENGSLRQCSLVSSNMAGGRLLPVSLAPDPKGL